MSLPTDLTTPKAAAALVGVHVNTVYRWIEEGTLKGYHVAGTRWRVSRADVLALVVAYEPAEPVRTTREDEEAAAAAVARMAARKGA